jgi:hypothetical protein
MTPRCGSALVAGCAVVVAALVAACGVPTTDGAERISADEIPRLLLEPTTTTTTAPPTTTTAVALTTTTVAPTTTTTAAPRPDALAVWMLGPDGLLLPVGRAYDGPAGTTPGLDEAIAALDAGPTEDEQAAGIRSALPSSGLFRLEGPPDRGNARVLLTPAFFEQVFDLDQPAAFGQIVFTITGAPDAAVSQVYFVLEEDPTQPFQILSGEGSLIPYGQREDYSTITTPPSTEPPA